MPPRCSLEYLCFKILHFFKQIHIYLKEDWKKKTSVVVKIVTTLVMTLAGNISFLHFYIYTHGCLQKRIASAKSRIKVSKPSNKTSLIHSVDISAFHTRNTSFFIVFSHVHQKGLLENDGIYTQMERNKTF